MRTITIEIVWPCIWVCNTFYKHTPILIVAGDIIERRLFRLGWVGRFRSTRTIGNSIDSSSTYGIACIAILSYASMNI